MYSLPIQNLIRTFSKLPSVGKRTAERYVFHLLKSGKKDVGELALALKNLSVSVKSCSVCWDFSDRSPCALCADPKRNQRVITVVAEPQHAQVIEKTGRYSGVYHILRGALRPDAPDRIKTLKIHELLKRAPAADEIIFALNPDLPGETTMMFLKSKIREINPSVKITRLARGLPVGSDLGYADEITLENALKNRTEAN